MRPRGWQWQGGHVEDDPHFAEWLHVETGTRVPCEQDAWISRAIHPIPANLRVYLAVPRGDKTDRLATIAVDDAAKSPLTVAATHWQPAMPDPRPPVRSRMLGDLSDVYDSGVIDMDATDPYGKYAAERGEDPADYDGRDDPGPWG